MCAGDIHVGVIRVDYAVVGLWFLYRQIGPFIHHTLTFKIYLTENEKIDWHLHESWALPPQACLPMLPQGVMRPPGQPPSPLQPPMPLRLAGALVEHTRPHKGPAPTPRQRLWLLFLAEIAAMFCLIYLPAHVASWAAHLENVPRVVITWSVSDSSARSSPVANSGLRVSELATMRSRSRPMWVLTHSWSSET